MPTVVLQLIRSYSAAHRVVELPSFPVKYHLLVADRQVADFELDWPKLLKEVDSLEQAPSAEQARGLGRAMREALIKSGWESVEAALKAALLGGEATLVIRSHADELYALPWEAMPFGPNDAPLAEVANLTVLYHEPSVLTPLAPVEPPRAALLAWSAGGKTVPHARVAEALGPTRTLAEPSLDQLVEALRSGEHDALVLLAHGGPGKDGVVLGWAGGSLSVVMLVENLRKLSTRPALVVVLACRAGAENAASLGFGGFGLELHRIGVAFVLASRWNVSFEGAVALAAGLRGGDLRGGLPVGEVERLGIVTFGSGVSLAPARRGALNAYLTALRTSFEALPWLSSQLGLARSLSEVFVHVQVCETARPHERRESLGGESVALEAVLGPPGGRWVMLGEPGSGKSTLLRRLALKLGAGGEWLPVLLHAGQLDHATSLDGAIKAVWGEAARALSAGWPRSRLVLLVDGLDEVGEPRATRTRLQALAADLGDATFIVAGRPEGAPEPWPGFGTLQLQPLSEPEQERLLRNLGVSEALIQSQLPEMRAHTRLRELVSRPLLLTLAALVLRKDGVLPRKRAQLYERAITILLHRHELNPEAPEDVVRAPDDTLAALRSLAPRLLRRGEGPWTREVCVELLREDRAVMERLRETWPTSTALEFLRESGRTLGLLTPQASERSYGFPHRTLGEYLTSLGLVADAAARLSAVREALRHPARWAEVLALTVSQLPPAEADGLVRALVDAGEAGRPLLLRVIASAEGLSPDTVREVLRLEGGWKMAKLQARQKVIEEIPALVNELAVAVGLLEQVAKATTCGHDLFWVREVLRRIEHGEAEGGVLDGSVDDAKRAAKGAADNVLSHLDHEKRAALLALLKPWWRPIPAGSFDMGSNNGDLDEKPVYRVTFMSGFQMLGVPVTWEMYVLFDPGHDAARSTFGGKLSPEAQEQVPVYNVSWYAAVMFAEWVGARLPLEPEWEYACRAETETAYWSGNTEADLEQVGWCSSNGEGHPHPVAEKPFNKWGLHDVHGNVHEWCLDAYDSEAYAPRADGLTVDPQALTFAVGNALPTSAEPAERGALRLFRGGSYFDWPALARSAFRGRRTPSLTLGVIGFRLLLPPPDPP